MGMANGSDKEDIPTSHGMDDHEEELPNSHVKDEDNTEELPNNSHGKDEDKNDDLPNGHGNDGDGECGDEEDRQYSDDEDEEIFIESDPSGRYARYNEILGQGAEKIVYKAYDKLDCKEVAWNKSKLKPPHSSHHALHEIELLQNINHRGILKLFASWIDPQEDTLNFITELCSSSLFTYRMKHKHMSKKALTRWGTQILEVLSHLHGHCPPIIHRDLKCENILVKSNSGMALRIGDFGLATQLNPIGYMHNMPVGTPEFMAPEMFHDDYNELVDVYSFGMCMIQLITRECPYKECKNITQVYKNVTHGIMPKALYRIKDEQVVEFIKKCLLPITQRPSAAELMLDPFLKCQEGSHEVISCIKKSVSVPIFAMLKGREDNVQHNTFGSHENLGRDMTMTRGPHGAIDSTFNQHHTIEPERNIVGAKQLDRKSSFRVMGKVVDEHTLHLKLRIDAPSNAHAIIFPFDLTKDSPKGVAEEMVRALNYPESDLIHIANLISEEVAELSIGSQLVSCAHVTDSCIADVHKLQTIDCR